MSTPSILVTGATGNIGQQVVKHLIADGANVYAGNRTGQAVAGAPGRTVNFEDAASLEKALEGIDRLFLLLPLVPRKLEMARTALDAAKAAGVGFVLRSSGAGADPQSPWAMPRLQGEIDQLVLESGIDHAIVRPSTFMQNFISFYGDMIKNGTTYLSHAEGKTSYVDVADIAAVSTAILLDPTHHKGQIYTVTGPQSLSVREALDFLQTELGRSITYVPVSEDAAVASMKAMGMDDWSIKIMSSFNQITASGLAAAVTTDVARVTGRQPRTFELFARENALAWRP